ncbi:16S rRNA (guanine527-N7)-methyltransferase [Pacificibacter maritimus]|uniref:Ribosomal RNA small subunit methyltransferase G n=1 Tax=Pacificibacter maritimus TaxID=762213 RepID=A0A3N4U1L7_9RHOB|nr:16S rRNA (guanine(527)-N(7))-methyltransferase RsmG [Pacificibacter maritimus]RPE64716.1 16S rRNA (guanine527-N7)-methyltransferase [Pacificibacter maritimus]
MTLSNNVFPNVSRETSDRLEVYEDLLKKWNPAINLVSKLSLNDLRNRHFIDSMQVFDLKSDSSKTWVDIGSGGGFPGLVCAIMAADAAPQIEFHLVESDIRKATFLRNVAREVGIKISVHSERIEKLNCFNADILSARALASLEKLLEFAVLHLSSGGVALFPKGVSFKEEIETARLEWKFDVIEYQSQTDENSVVLKVGNIARV